jgi:hypothetical protein
MIGGSPIEYAPMTFQPFNAPAPRRVAPPPQPQIAAAPKPKRTEQVSTRVSFPSPDELGIRLTESETVTLPPPEELGISPK